jgi:hypothetical protein
MSFTRDSTAPWAGPPRTVPNRRAAASPHPRARLHAIAGPELRSSARVASHVPQLLHTGASLFPCRSTPSHQYCAAPPPTFVRLRAIACRGLALAPHAPRAPCQLTPSAPLARAAAPHLHSHARAVASPASLTRTSRAARARLELCRPAPAPWLRPASLLPCCALVPAEPRVHQCRHLRSSAVRRSGHQRRLEQLPLARRRRARRAAACSSARRLGLARCPKLHRAAALRLRLRSSARPSPLRAPAPEPGRPVPVEGREGGEKARRERERKRSIWMEPPVGEERDQIKEEQRRKGKRTSQGLICKFRKLQGPFCKVKFPINTKL